MEKFYHYVINGENRASALSKAQADLRSVNQHRYAHPYYWAGFVLSGDPGRGKK
jgi:CHAT domain-containing protein